MAPGSPPPTKIFVGRLPPDANPGELRRMFEKYGVVTECDILTRFGFVHMKTEEMAEKAIRELNNKDFCGSRISVEASTGKKGGGRGGGRGGFRGGRGGGGYRPYDRSGPRDYDRGPRDSRGPPMGGRNGFYDRGSSGYDDYYRRPMMPSMGSMYSRESRYGDSYMDRRPPMSSVSPYERRDSYGGSLGGGSDLFRRRSPPPISAGYDRPSSGYDRDPYGPPSMRRYPPSHSALDRDMPPARRF